MAHITAPVSPLPATSNCISSAGDQMAPCATYTHLPGLTMNRACLLSKGSFHVQYLATLLSLHTKGLCVGVAEAGGRAGQERPCGKDSWIPSLFQCWLSLQACTWGNLTLQQRGWKPQVGQRPLPLSCVSPTWLESFTWQETRP